MKLMVGLDMEIGWELAINHTLKEHIVHLKRQKLLYTRLS